MIHVVVGTSHVSAILGYRRGHRFNDVLRRTLEPLVGRPVRTVNTPHDLAGVTVFKVLEDFHNRASALLRAEPAEVMAAQRDEIMRVARQEYHYPDFEATVEDACRSVAIHGLFPHGTLTSRTTTAFLPEFSIGVRCFGFFRRSPSSVPSLEHIQQFEECAASIWRLLSRVMEKAGAGRRLLYNDAIYGLDSRLIDEAAIRETISQLVSLREHLRPPFAPHRLLEAVNFFIQPDRELREALAHFPLVARALEEMVCRLEAPTIPCLWDIHTLDPQDLHPLECHLCDTLQDVYDRADSYWHKLGESFLNGMQFERSVEENWLVIDAVIHGFQGHRSLRRDNSEVPALGNHRLLAGKATRQGIGKPVVSGLFPISLWRLMEGPVQHFILNAAEKGGADQCPPLYPNMPSEEDMHLLHRAVESAEGEVGMLPFDVEDFSDSLRKLGIEAAVRRRSTAYRERLEGGEWAWDWTRAIFEYESALYDDDIEQSLHLQDLLDLYPLHKRVLGLVEYILVPRLVSRGVGGNAASALWTNAFTGSGLLSASLPSRAALLATLETEGNWLLHAAGHEASGRTSPIDLAALLDGIVTRMSSAAEVGGLSVNLQPPTPQVHARQLAALADRSNHNPACMTLYLGKVALMLRNAVEHGTDRVQGDGLLVDTTHYWDQNRAGKPILTWLADTARQVSWRSGPTFPATLPSAANAIMLTPASLHRCLALLSLVLHAGFSQLGL